MYSREIKDIMLDMYPSGRTYQRQVKDVQKEFCYFDNDTYNWLNNKDVDILVGGPRRKCKSVVWLSKTPLFYFKPLELLSSAHYMYPYQKHDDFKCLLELLHYKFAYKGSWDNMREYVKKGTDKNRIEESTACLKKRGTRFFYEGSVKLDCIEKLSEIPFMADITS